MVGKPESSSLLGVDSSVVFEGVLMSAEPSSETPPSRGPRATRTEPEGERSSGGSDEEAIIFSFETKKLENKIPAPRDEPKREELQEKSLQGVQNGGIKT
jgi:hypothetical protein